MRKLRKDCVDRTGEKWLTNEGYWVTIVESYNKKNCTLQFENGLTIKNREYPQIKRGGIKNPYHPSVCGIGYFGVGKYKAIERGKKTIVYYRWICMIGRCYDEKTKEAHPTYKDCVVDSRWHNFQVFAEWFEDNFLPHMDSYWQLDKDILFKGNKIYSPETCCFVPQEINKQLIGVNSERPIPTGVYKNSLKWVATLGTGKRSKELGRYKTMEEASEVYIKAKEDRLKNLANKWKDFLRPDVYDRLLEIKF